MLSKDILDKIKILAFDVDDTLLNKDSVLSEETKKSIIRAMEKGYHVVIATGRVLSAVPSEVISLKGIRYAVTSNGARISDLHNGETIYTNFLAKEEVEKLLPLLSDSTVMKEVFYDNQVYADQECLDDLPRYGVKNEWNKNYIKTTRKPVESTMQLIKEHIDSLENINLTFSSLQKRDEFLKKLKKSTTLSIFSSPPFCSTSDAIEIGGRTASKAQALKALAEILKTGNDSIMAFGDSSNDLQMIKMAAVGVAMGNGVPEVKEAADYVTDSNAEDGVATALKKLLDII
ncbi:MAG: HAD family phosphatase [Clostridia bacterium]|nr:HAD family phosphatase [Clostridia bacterium]